jgi:hypothetical protein
MLKVASVMVPVAAGLVKENAVMALVALGAVGVGGGHDTTAKTTKRVMKNVFKRLDFIIFLLRDNELTTLIPFLSPCQ